MAPLNRFAWPLLMLIGVATLAPRHRSFVAAAARPPAVGGGDAISREFYGRIRELLDQNVPLTSDDQAELMAVASAAATSAGHDGAAPQRLVDTTHLDSPPKPRALTGWPSVQLQVGQITAVAVNADGNPVIFHRGERIWDAE